MPQSEDWSPEPDRAWVAGANCAGTDPEAFFPGSSQVGTARKARAICGWCASLAECREYAVADRTITAGIWGGLSSKQRQAARARADRREDGTT
jgi:WhiB family redox-sensing transcriptional regulator